MPFPPIKKFELISRQSLDSITNEDSRARKIRFLKGIFPHAYALREAKNDGNGFYRATMYAHIEMIIMQGPNELLTFIAQ